MNKEYLIDGINKLGPWFHRIDFPNGVSTKTDAYTGEDGDHPIPTWNRLKSIIPIDLSGKTVLDVGCNAGFYSFRCRERNAKYVLGVDARLWHVRQARFAAMGLQQDSIDFRRSSVYELSPTTTGKFDIVLALGLIYHLKHIYQAVDNLYHITNDLLIIETAIVPSEYNWPTDCTYGIDKKNMEAIGLISNDFSEPEPPCNWFIPTPKAVSFLLKSTGFVDVCIEDVSPSRAIVSARKPKAASDSKYSLGISGNIQIPEKLHSLAKAPTQPLSVLVSNTGKSIWLSPSDTDNGGVYLYGTAVSSENPLQSINLPWIPLPHKLLPGESIMIEYYLPVFPNTGLFEIEFDLIAQGVGNFQDFGVVPFSFSILVKD